MSVTTLAVRERPIIFSAPSVRSIQADQKTQTRRVVKAAHLRNLALGVRRARAEWGDPAFVGIAIRDVPERVLTLCPYGAVGDRLWVRETWKAQFEWPADVGDTRLQPWGRVPAAFRGVKNAMYLQYRADHSEYSVDHLSDDRTEIGLCRATEPLTENDEDDVGCQWRSSRFMPRWASRILLEITVVCAERLQEIREADAIAEGVEDRRAYVKLWDSLNAKRGYGWDVNPWVWAITFRRITP